MRTPSFRTFSSVLALSVAGTPAMADVTAAELLNEWQSSFADAGQVLEYDGREETSDGIVLTDMSTSIPIEDAKLRFTAPIVELNETGNGRVQISFPEDITVTIGDGDDVMTGRYMHEDLDLSAGGDAGARDYAYNATSAEFVMDVITDGGEPIPFEMSVIMDAISATYAMGEEVQSTTYTLGSLSVNVAAENPDAVPEPETFSLSYEIKGIVGESEANPMLMFQTDDPSELLASGIGTSGTLVHAGSGYTFDLVSNDATALVDGSSGGGAYSVSLAEEGIAYDLAGQDIKMRYQGDQLPFPVEVALDSFGLELGIPLLASKEEQPFSFLFALGALEISDGIWNLFDPGEVLPRDPGELEIDVTGSLLLQEDLIAADPMMGPPPAEVNQLDLNTLLLSVVGAELTGNGGFALDFSKPGLAPGAPSAVGKLNLELVGANQLIDKLVQIGILQAQDVAGIRMMMGMAARPGDEPDSLVSEIELTPNGELIANGMRLQ